MHVFRKQNRRIGNLQCIKGFCLNRVIYIINMYRRFASFEKERVTQDGGEKCN